MTLKELQSDYGPHPDNVTEKRIDEKDLKNPQQFEKSHQKSNGINWSGNNVCLKNLKVSFVEVKQIGFLVWASVKCEIREAEKTTLSDAQLNTLLYAVILSHR